MQKADLWRGIDLSTRSDAELQTRNDLGSLAARSPKKAGSEDNEDISKRNVNTCVSHLHESDEKR